MSSINIKNILGKNIKKAREARNISQEKFSELIGIGASALSKIESGKSYPTIQTLEQIVKILKIKPYILYITDEDFNIDTAYKDILIRIEKLKNDKTSFKSAYEFICELTNKL